MLRSGSHRYDVRTRAAPDSEPLDVQPNLLQSHWKTSTCGDAAAAAQGRRTPDSNDQSAHCGSRSPLRVWTRPEHLCPCVPRCLWNESARIPPTLKEVGNKLLVARP